jgi:lipopolysaccharide export system permease protein
VVIKRYFFKEISLTLVGVVSILLLIFMSKHFVRYMSDAAAGELPTELIVQLLLLFTLSYLPLILPFALFIAILVAMGRLYKDSEITAMEACGIGIPSIMKTTLSIGVLLATLVGTLSIWAAPWAEKRQYELRDVAEVQSEFSFLAPGRFHEIRGGDGVFYVESMSEDKRFMENVFVFLNREGGQDVFVAEKGYQNSEESGARYIVLEDGSRFEVMPDRQGFRLHEYERSGIRVSPQDIEAGSRPRAAWSNEQLFVSDTRADMAEWQWRLSMPISCVLLTLLAVVMSRTNPRQGRFAKLFAALLIYIVYFYLLTLANAWVKDAVVPTHIGMWWVHALMLVLTSWLLVRQLGVRWVMETLRLRQA